MSSRHAALPGPAAAPQLHAMPRLDEAIVDSWRRCRASGLDEDARPDPGLLTAASLRERQQAALPLLDAARPQLQSLHAQMAAAGQVAVVCDADGMILDTVGEPVFLRDAERLALRPGACWTEHARGTNAIGTALALGGAVRVHAGQHYMRRHHRLSCAAAPVHGADGRLLGLIDVSGPPERAPEDVLARVRAASAIATQQCFVAAHPGATLVAVHADARKLGLPHARLLAFDRDGCLIGVSGGPDAGDETLGAMRAGLAQDAGRWLHALARAAHAQRTPDGGLHARLLRPAATAIGRSAASPSGAWAPGPIAAVRRARAEDEAGQTPASAPFAPASHRPGHATSEATRGQVAAEQAACEAAPCPASADCQTPAAPLRPAPSGAFSGVPAKLRDTALRLLAADIPVLLQGETGTGKEVLARWLHRHGPLADRPFVAINCAAIPENLIEAELFGYEEGAFTGARRKGMPGRLVEADGGILFLDEIGDMPHALQSRLLRVLQDRVVSPLGGGLGRPVSFRLVCATHRDLDALAESGAFRADLLYRINHFPLRLPALRERAGIDAIIDTVFATHGASARGVTLAPALRRALSAYHWPGNMRQLDNLVATLLALADDGDTLNLDALPDGLRHALAAGPASTEPDCTALIRQHGGASAAARAMGWSRSTFYRRLRAQAARG